MIDWKKLAFDSKIPKIVPYCRKFLSNNDSVFLGNVSITQSHVLYIAVSIKFQLVLTSVMSFWCLYWELGTDFAYCPGALFVQVSFMWIKI